MVARGDVMAEYTAIAPQTVESNQNVLLDETAIKGNKCIQHREGSGIVTLRGITHDCKARFKVSYYTNIAIPTGQAILPISTALAIEGESLQSTNAITTPVAVETFFNVSGSAVIDVPQGCCMTIALENTSAIPVTFVNTNVIAERIA